MNGLMFFKKTNVKNSGYVLVSWHNPKSITWRWAIWWRWSKNLSVKWWRGPNGHAFLIVSSPLTGTFDFRLQPHMWRHLDNESTRTRCDKSNSKTS